MSDVVKLEALANELSHDDSEQTAAVSDHPELKTLELLLSKTRERLTEIDTLTSERDNYQRGLEASEAARAADGEAYEAEIALLNRTLAKLKSDLAFFQSAFDGSRETLEAVERLVTRGRMDAQHTFANRPRPDDPPLDVPDDDQPAPRFLLRGRPEPANVRRLQIPQASDITRFAPPPGMRSKS